MTTGAGLYKLDCQLCELTVTVPPTDGVHACPSYDAVLEIHWSAEILGQKSTQEAPRRMLAPER
jgi:hypothetical protein